MDLDALVERTRRLTGIEMETIRSNDDIKQSINEAYDEILDVEQWTFLRTNATFDTVSGEPIYKLPTSFRELHSVSIVGRFRETSDGEVEVKNERNGMGIVSPRSVRSGDARTEEPPQDAPEYYTLVEPDTIEFWPAPDKAYTVRVRGRKLVPDLTGGTNTPIFEDTFHPLVAYLAAYTILIEEGDDTGRVEDYSERIVNFLSRMRTRYQQRHDKEPLIMGGQAHRRKRQIPAGKLWA